MTLSVSTSGTSHEAPLTFGQLSVLRSLRDDVNTISANKRRVVDLPGPVPVERVRSALKAMVRRHEGLRTVFHLPADGTAKQMVLAAFPVPERLVELPEDTPAVRAAVAATLEAEPFDIEHEPGWRAAVLTSGGVAVGVALAMHHMLADGWASRLLERELLRLVEDPAVDLAPALGPAHLALRQQGPDWDMYRTLFEEHWEPMFRQPERFPSDGVTAAGPRIIATAVLKSSRTDLDPLARRLGVFSSTLVTALAMLSWPAVGGLDDATHSATLMNGGRLDADLETLVSSQNQIVPVGLPRCQNETLRNLLGRLQNATTDAAMAGMYDVDEVCARGGVSNINDLMDFWVNVMVETPRAPLTVETGPAVRPAVQFQTLPYCAWPHFYYRISVDDPVTVALSVKPEAASPADLERVLRGWDTALARVHEDPDVTVAEIANCFLPNERNA